MNNMDALLSDLDYVLRDVQAILREGMPCLDADADSLAWLNVSTVFLLRIQFDYYSEILL